MGPRTMTRVALQPATPVVVPPTPMGTASPAAGSSRLAANSYSPKGPSPSNSSHDLFNDPEDAERQTNRRSMYRSPGTSSSPDLATLLRKAKERGGVIVGTHHKKEKRRESPPPLPQFQPHQTQQQPTSVSSYSSSTLVACPPSRGDQSPDWILTSPRQTKDNGTVKAPKSTVRAKTSAFWGKMMGQNTVRERSKTDASLHPNPPSSLMNAFTPPVPAIPVQHRTPVTSPIADVFSTTNRTRHMGKPLPPVVSDTSTAADDSDDRSMVFVDKMSALPPLPPATPPTKRRSMSVSDAHTKAILSQTPDRELDNKAATTEDSTLHGIFDVFKGELSSLEPFSGSCLDLRDPSTPSRQLALRSKADSLVLPSRDIQRADNTKQSSAPSLSAAAVTERPGTSGSTIIPPRSSSLQSPARYSVGHASTSRQLHATPLRSRSGPSTALAAQSQSPHRLRVLHRSTASNSEPSLIPAADDGRVCKPVDIPSIQLLKSEADSVSPHRMSSQQNLVSPDLPSFPASSTSISSRDDAVDMETRGKELAGRCWDEHDDFLAKEKIAEWLGGHGQINQAALRHYVDFFDFAGLRLDIAFRNLCSKLYLKAETQQVDRILEQFSRRYWDCNPGGLYGSANIVHAVSYSLLLLNTDLHVAELSTHMSRTQFVRNTLTAVQTQFQPSTSARLSSSDLTYDDCGSSVRGAGSDETETMTRSKRSDSIASWNSLPREVIMTLPVSPSSNVGAHMSNGSNPSIQISNGYDLGASSSRHPTPYGRAWENDMESLLKEMYNAIKHQQILQPLNSSAARPSMSSLSPGGAGMMRNRSIRSQNDRLTTLKRGSIRGLQSVLGQSVSPYSSNSSIDGRVSPSPSFATSTHEAIFGSSSSFLNPTLGFASNLSHTIIREAQEDDDRSVHSEQSTSTTISISDEELALLGPPWAKEGMLWRKQYWESAGKRAKDKAWMDVFVVIQKGQLSMFIFGDNTAGASGTFGGGNWLANARPVGVIHLAHSLAHALPPPGYGKRPHCMVLTLANRGVYFFQAGTEELVNEWVSTCNYWAARTSKEPLSGGVSNMEYGWNRVADLYGHRKSHSQTELSREPDVPDTVSVRSGKSNRSKYGWRDGSATVRGPYSPRGDKTFINEWKAPLPPTVSSLHDEESQLDALRKHVSSLKKDLETHNELRGPMAALYQPRTSSAMRAQSNWEEKSQYLLREIVKYELYIDSLQVAMSLRLKKRGEKALERALSNSNPLEEPEGESKSTAEGSSEEVEPTTPHPR